MIRSRAAAALGAGLLALGACGGEPAAPAGDGGGGSRAESTAATTTSTSSSSGAVAVGSGGSVPLPPTFHVRGRVVNRDGGVVPGATVMQGGGPVPATTTGDDGRYDVELTLDVPGTPTVVAAKVGYRAGGVDFTSLPSGDVDITVVEASPPDNPSYTFGDPGTGDVVHDATTAYCGHCHTTFVAQFQGSMHAAAARDPLVQDLYAGVASAFSDAAACAAAGGVMRAGAALGAPGQSATRCYVGGGVLPDLNPACASDAQACDDPALPAAKKPTAFGACADCHAPGIDGPAGGRDLLEASRIAYENGNHCDVCHHVRDVDLTKPAGVAGALVLQRPRERIHEGQIPPSDWLQVMFGPLPDVPNSFMGGSWQPKFKTAELCGGCHEQRQQALAPGASLDPARWPDGLPIHSTYTEWQGSGFSSPCQDCHMPPDASGLTNALDVTSPDQAGIVYGFARTPDDIRQHVFRHPLDGSPRLIDAAVGVSTLVTVGASDVTVEAHVVNANAGHAIPTGEPMRALVLLVTAEACGAPLGATGGLTLPDLAGARATGVVGADVSAAGATLTWAAGAAVAKPGDVVRAVRPTGTFDDYTGIGFFAGKSPAEKNVEIRAPLGEARVASSGGGSITLDAALAVQAGDVVHLGDARPATAADGDPSLALAGLPGAYFARVLAGADGTRGVPQHLAVDLASDDRIPPQGEQKTTHVFARPAGCASATVRATLVYRPVPVDAARLRGWDARDYVVAASARDVALP